jgi:hypothetical protein
MWAKRRRCAAWSRPRNTASQSGGRPTFLDFVRPDPDAIFTALILGTDRAKFGTPEKAAQGKKVCVTRRNQALRR